MFSNCKMRGTLFDSCIMRGTRFIESDMTNAKLDNSDATGALFVRCNVTDLSLNDTNLFGARFEDCMDNGVAITQDWLREHGALNADNATVVNLLSSELKNSSLKLITQQNIFRRPVLGCEPPPGSMLDEIGRTIVPGAGRK